MQPRHAWHEACPPDDGATKKEKDTKGNVNQKEYNDEMENLNDFKTTAFKNFQKAIFVP